MDSYIYQKSEFNRKKRQKEQAVDSFAKENLKKKIKLSLMTCAVGALADFEKEFGKEWGHGQHLSELSTEQKAGRHHWEKIRTSILDRANNGIKICANEINRCEIKNYEERKYEIKFEREK